MIAVESDFSGATWFKSSHSGGNNGACIEVASRSGWVGMRDTKHHGAGPALAFSTPEWAAFIAGVRRGEFDPS